MDEECAKKGMSKQSEGEKEYVNDKWRVGKIKEGMDEDSLGREKNSCHVM